MFESTNLLLGNFSLGVVILGVIYFTPAIIASVRRHPNTTAVFVVDLLLGWTIVGWIVALIWSFTNPPRSRTVLPPQPVGRIADELAKLADLRDRNLLTDDEYEAQKSKLLGST